MMSEREALHAVAAGLVEAASVLAALVDDRVIQSKTLQELIDDGDEPQQMGAAATVAVAWAALDLAQLGVAVPAEVFKRLCISATENVEETRSQLAATLAALIDNGLPIEVQDVDTDARRGADE